MKKNIHKTIKWEEIAKKILLTLTVIGFFFSLYYVINNMNYPRNVNIVLMLPFIFFLAPYLIIGLYQVKRIEAKMEIIPRFLRDIVDNVESGMDLASAIENTINNEYSVLNDDVRKFANQLSWGIEFEEALLNFSENIGSKTLRRDFLLVSEARKVGGHVEKILRELSLKINMENLRNKERRSNLASNTFTGYISFIIFIFIIVLVYNNLFLDLGSTLSANEQEADVTEENNSMMLIYLTLLMLLTYELAILSGFLFGLMQENDIIAGAPHVVALVIMSFIGFFFFIKVV
jgi:pilus assembly protein TadC